MEHFGHITDGSLDDIDCPWKIESIDIKDEIYENPESPENVIENIMIKVEPMDLDNAIDKISQQNKEVNTTKSEYSRTSRRMTHKCDICGFLLPTEYSLNNPIERRHENLETNVKESVEIITPQVKSDKEPIVSGVNIKLGNESDLKSSAKTSSDISQSNFQDKSNQEINENESIVKTLNQCGLCGELLNFFHESFLLVTIIFKEYIFFQIKNSIMNRN